MSAKVYLSIALILLISVTVEGANEGKRSRRSLSLHSQSFAPMTNAQVALHITELINRYPVVVFATSTCQYSKRAKQVFSKYRLGNNYKILDLDTSFPTATVDQYIAELARRTGGDTVPRVFIGRRFVGGGTDVEALDRSGQLTTLLQNARAFV